MAENTLPTSAIAVPAVEEETLIQGSKVLITIATMLAALMAILDISIVNVALSDIRASFGTPLDQIAWVSTGYMMANVVVIPMTGWFQRKFGFRNYFAGSIILFTVASALCGLAWNLPSLVMFRVIQGMGGGAIIPTAQTILFNRYPKREHGMAGALFALGAITGPLFGPTLGGYLIDWFSWHWIFLINVPLGIGAAILVFSVVKEKKQEVRKVPPFDVLGFSMLAVGMASLQYVLEEGNREGWFDSVLMIVLACMAVTFLVTFVVRQLEADDPIVDFKIFANRNYALASSLNALLGVALFSGSFLYSLFCGAVLHYTAKDIGLLFLEGSVIQIFMMPLLGKFSGRFDPRRLTLIGLTTMCVSLWTNAQLTNQSGNLQLIAPLFIRALGMGFIFIPLSLIALSQMPAERRGSATGLFNLTRELGGSIGTAWMSSSLDRHTKEYASNMSSHVTNFSPAALEQLQIFKGVTAQKSTDTLSSGIAILQQKVGMQALIRAFNNSFFELLILFVLAYVVVFAMKKPSGPAGDLSGVH